MFRLQPHQRLALDSFQQRSFEDYCSTMKYDPAQHEAILLEGAKDNWRRFMAALRETAGDADAAASIADEYLSARTWWDIKQLQIRDDVQRLAENIASAHEILPIDWQYLRAISAEGDIPSPEIADPESLPRFLKEVPHILVYGSEFNAFVVRQRSLGDIPCVFIYEQLMASVDLFLNVMLKQLIVLKPNGNFTIVDDELWPSLGANPDFSDALRSAIDMALLRTDSAWIPESLALSQAPGLYLIVNRFISLGAGDFVRLHEYGHLLMGHLRCRQRPALELLADRFAMSVLGAQTEDVPGSKLWVKLGAIGALVVMMIRDFVEKPSTSTHPSSRARVRALLRDTSTESLWLRLHVRAMLALSRHTLERVYRLTLAPRHG